MTSNRSLMVIAALVAGCGANVVFEGPGDGGGGSSGLTSPTTSSIMTGPAHCDSHTDCSPLVCVFSTGTCARPCEDGTCDSCGEGLFCESCATSACPDCLDCRAACVPTAPGRCDEDDACPPDSACVYESGVCMKVCDGDDDCGDFEFCDACATGSCCGCKNCVAVCAGGR